jgi:hypothetical protein
MFEIVNSENFMVFDRLYDMKYAVQTTQLLNEKENSAKWFIRFDKDLKVFLKED